jgi:hypothetical protein
MSKQFFAGVVIVQTVLLDDFFWKSYRLMKGTIGKNT